MSEPWTEAEERKVRQYVDDRYGGAFVMQDMRRALATLAAVRQERDHWKNGCDRLTKLLTEAHQLMADMRRERDALLKQVDEGKKG